MFAPERPEKGVYREGGGDVAGLSADTVFFVHLFISLWIFYRAFGRRKRREIDTTAAFILVLHHRQLLVEKSNNVTYSKCNYLSIYRYFTEILEGKSAWIAKFFY